MSKLIVIIRDHTVSYWKIFRSYIQQDRKCPYYIFRVCVCSLPCAARAILYWYLWPVWLCHIFPRHLINSTFFIKKNLLNIKCVVFKFSLWLLYKKILILRCFSEISLTFVSLMYPLFFSGFNETWISWTVFFEKYSNIKFCEIFFGGSRIVPCGRTDRHEEAHTRFSQFCECV